MYSKSYRHYVTGLLFIVYVCNQTDRSIFAFLMEPVKNDLRLSDIQLGFVAGPALGLLYTLLGVPVARWGDRSNRINIMSGAIAIWSCAVMLFAEVGKFWHLAFAQVGVGIGEAGFSAIAMSVIGDYHSTDAERSRALSTFMLAIPVAGALSSLMAGWINENYGWRAVFVIAGIPGILLALLMKWTIHEPPRRSVSVVVTPASDRPTLRTVFTTLWQQPTLRHLAIGQCLANVVACCVNWLPPYFVRNNGISTGELGVWFGLIYGVGGGGGIWLSGYLSSRYGAGDERTKLWLMAGATALVAPILVFTLWSTSAQLALVALIPCQALMYFFLTPTMAIIQTLAAPNMRATMASVFILFQVLIGSIIGIQLLGVISDALTPVLGSSAVALRWSIALVCPLAIWSGIHFWMAARSLPPGANANPAELSRSRAIAP